MIKRRKTRNVKIGNIVIGGGHPVAIQSMAKTKTADIAKTIAQINELAKAGCEIVRVAVKDSADAKAIRQIKPSITIPLVADIHFHWKLAIESIESGADKIRLNPGNIYKKNEVAQVISALKSAKKPLRIGLNSGSVEGSGVNSKLSMPKRLVLAATKYLHMVEKMKFFDTVISLKASDVQETVEAYRLMANVCDYPLHLGVTATGLPFSGAIKSSIAVGTLLYEGIGDTIRISLTDSPTREIEAARAILEALKLRNFGPEIISCPTCGRCEVDLIAIVKELEKKLSACPPLAGERYTLYAPTSIAVMGCVVNGPGEAKEADLGIAFGKNQGVLFKKGKLLRKVSYDRCVDELLKLLSHCERSEAI